MFKTLLCIWRCFIFYKCFKLWSINTTFMHSVFFTNNVMCFALFECPKNDYYKTYIQIVKKEKLWDLNVLSNAFLKVTLCVFFCLVFTHSNYVQVSWNVFFFCKLKEYLPIFCMRKKNQIHNIYFWKLQNQKSYYFLNKTISKIGYFTYICRFI